MKDTETSVTFHISKEILNEFEIATKEKEKKIGIKLSRKQALHLAITEATQSWKKN